MTIKDKALLLKARRQANELFFSTCPGATLEDLSRCFEDNMRVD